MKLLAGDAAAPLATRWQLDPRLYQIAVLASLLVYGMSRLGFDVSPGRAVAILAAALGTQLACTALAARPAFDPRSALISGLSLCLLLRTNDPRLAVLAAVVAVASKFVLRVGASTSSTPPTSPSSR